MRASRVGGWPTYVARYVPFGIFMTALVLALLLVPSVSTTGQAASTAPSGGSVALPPGVTPAAAPGTPGRTVGGVTCAPGVRQLPGSAYAPECVPAWHGNNGGATAPGVTSTTITLTYREFSSFDLSALYSLIPKPIIGTNDEAITTLNSYVKVFNKYFELYGRHVVLKSFNGRGDLINEMTGSGQAEAVDDAVSAKSMGAFADMSLADTSEFYTSALAQQKIIAFPLLYMQDAKSYLKAEPYIYTPGPDCDKSNAAIAAAVGNGMKNMPAIYAGDPALQSSKRSFGIIYNDNPFAQQCENGLASELSRYGVQPAKIGSFNFTPSSLPEQIISLIEQMKAAGVTTIIFADEDPVSPGLFMSQAAADSYHPEWMMLPSFTGGNVDADAIARHFASEAPTEMDHLIEPGIQSSPAKSQEDYRFFEQGAPGGDPLPTYSLAWTYAPVMILFSALQAAGPNLTPQTFQKAFHSLTASPGGMYGQWTFGPGIADPASGFQLLYWDPSATSNQDGLPGALLACNGGRHYTYTGAAHEIAAHHQIDCYGNSPPAQG